MQDVGPGVYDVHSPVVPRSVGPPFSRSIYDFLPVASSLHVKLGFLSDWPASCSVEFMSQKIESFLESKILKGHLDRIWVK